MSTETFYDSIFHMKNNYFPRKRSSEIRSAAKQSKTMEEFASILLISQSYARSLAKGCGATHLLEDYRSKVAERHLKTDPTLVPVIRWLDTKGLKFEAAGFHSPFDGLVNGKKVEVKSANPHAGRLHTTWMINIQRNGKLNEREVDFYIFRLSGVPEFKNAIHLVVPAPLGKYTVAITMRSLLTRWGRFYNRVDFLL